MKNYNITSVRKERILGLPFVYIDYTIDDKEYSDRLGPGKFTYGGIVDTVITHEYPNDRMQAIINNYLIKAEGSEEEFNEMQDFRAMAKKLAKEALNSADEQSQS